MPITFENGSEIECEEHHLLALAAHTLKFMEIDRSAELAILAVTEEEMADLNLEWMDEIGATDVLSFPIDELKPDLPFREGEGTLGDVVLCPSVAQKQAVFANHSTLIELEILLVHGILHLMGLDHAQPEQEHEMFRLQREIIENWKKLE